MQPSGREDLLRLVSENEVRRVIDIMLSITKTKRLDRLYDQIVMISSKENQYLDNKRRGSISYSELEVDRSKIITSLVELIRALPDDGIDSLNSNGTLQKNWLTNSNWYFYFYDFKSRWNKPRIKRLNLKIDLNDISLENIKKTGVGEDYKGKYDSENSAYDTLIYNLASLRTKKNLQLRVRAKDGNNDIYIGQYIDQGDNYEIITGTFLMEKMVERDFLEPITFNKFNDSNSLNPVINNYLISRYLNCTKSPKEYHRTIYDLQSWIDRQREIFKKRDIDFESIYYRERDLDLFVVAPYTGASEQFINNVKLAINSIKSNPSISLEKIFYFPLDFPDKESKKDADIVFENELDKFYRAKCFFYIFPKREDSFKVESRITGALIQLGWTFILRKPTIIFHECPRHELPHMIGSDNSNLFNSFIQVIQIDSVSSIPNWLMNHPSKWKWILSHYR